MLDIDTNVGKENVTHKSTTTYEIKIIDSGRIDDFGFNIYYAEIPEHYDMEKKFKVIINDYQMWRVFLKESIESRIMAINGGALRIPGVNCDNNYIPYKMPPSGAGQG